MSTLSINLADCKVKITVKKHQTNPRQLQVVKVTVTHPNKTKLATLHALKIHRFRCEDQFYSIMDEESDEMMWEFGSQLFDKYAKFKPQLFQHEFHKGTGCWNEELNEGDMVYIDTIWVEENARNKGVGSWMLQQLMDSEHVGKEDTVYCWPCPCYPVEGQEWDTQQINILKFFRKNDFRRVGRTDFFARSPDAQHPSRRIQPGDDLDPTDDYPSTTTDNEACPVPPRERFPLHTAILDGNENSIAAYIQDAYNKDPSVIHQQDQMGFRPIYIAAEVANVAAVVKLIALGVQKDLLLRDNKDHSTPLEACIESLESGRRLREMFSDWTGYPEEKLRVKLALQRAMGESIPETDEKVIAQSKWGCTCGKCVDSWLSARMKYRLSSAADTDYEFLGTTIDLFYSVTRQPQTLQSGHFLGQAMNYIPDSVGTEIYKTFVVGYRTVIKAIQNVLESPGSTSAPTHSNVMAELRNSGIIGHFDKCSADHFFAKGGRIDFALDSITGQAKEDEMFDDICETIDEWRNLPTCKNDLEFDIVRRMLGLERRQRWGPYRGVCARPMYPGMVFEEDASDDNEIDEEEEDIIETILMKMIAKRMIKTIKTATMQT